MASIRILSQPEVHPEGDAFFLTVDCNVFDDFGREVPGFHKTVKIPLALLPDLIDQPDMAAAFGYIVAQIGAVDPAYTENRILEAITAMQLRDLLVESVAAEGLTFPLDIPIAPPPADSVASELSNG